MLERHAEFISSVFVQHVKHKDRWADVSVVCEDGELVLNKLLVGLLFPHLKYSSEFHYSICDKILLPFHLMSDVHLLINKFLNQSLNEEAGIQDNIIQDDPVKIQLLDENINENPLNIKLLDELASLKTESPEDCDKAGDLDESENIKEPEDDIDLDEVDDPEEMNEPDDEKKLEDDPDRNIPVFIVEEEISEFYPVPDAKRIKPSVQCNRCSQSFQTQGDLKNHTRAHHSFPCQICSLDFSTPVLLLRHVKSKHACSTTPHSVLKEKKIPGGVNTDNPAAVGNATVGNPVGNPAAVGNATEATKGKRGIFKCSQCPLEFSYQTKLDVHFQIHSKPFKCTQCDNSFSSRSKLNIHNLEEHKTELPGCQLHKCSHCGKVFSAPSLLNQHMRTHTHERPFTCDVCAKSFAVKHNLRVHYRIHTGNSKIYPCRHPPCLRKFSHTTERKDHESVHTGDKLFRCPHCLKSFPRNGNLWKHKKRCGLELGMAGLETNVQPTIAQDSSVKPITALDTSVQPITALKTSVKPMIAQDTKTQPMTTPDIKVQPMTTQNTRIKSIANLGIGVQPIANLGSNTQPITALLKRIRPTATIDKINRPTKAVKTRNQPLVALDSEEGRESLDMQVTCDEQTNQSPVFEVGTGVFEPETAVFEPGETVFEVGITEVVVESIIGS